MAMKRWQKLAAGGAGATLIAAAMTVGWEGTQNRAYYDKMGHVWTICTGHTGGVVAGEVATDDQCQSWLIQDQLQAAVAVNRCITADLTPTQRAAFIDAAFNVGPSIVCGSTLQRLANSGDMMGACLQLTDAMDKHGNNVGWTFSGGQPIQGLRNRRVDERNACMGYLK